MNIFCTIALIVGIIFVLYRFFDWILPEPSTRNYEIKEIRFKQGKYINGSKRPDLVYYAITYKNKFRRRRYLHFPNLEESLENGYKIHWCITFFGKGCCSDPLRDKSTAEGLLKDINENNLEKFV